MTFPAPLSSCMACLRRHPSRLVPLLLLTSACEKTIDLDYRTAEPQIVVEAAVTESGTTATVTTTQPMTGSATGHGVTTAQVTISSGDSISRRLVHRGDGRYTTFVAGKPGTTYRLTVQVGDRTFTSTSIMQTAPQLAAFRFVWRTFLGERLLFGDVRLQDTPGKTDYYFLHLYRNGLGYRWAVMTDRSAPGGELRQLFTCQREGSNDADDLREGDRLHLVVRHIDQRAYDYLYSMQIMDDAGTNPVANFAGGCLGYFSAYGETTLDTLFRLADVEEEP